jgi:hypothetical protein
MLCREEKQCALNDRIIKNGPRNENQRIATAFFSSLLDLNSVSLRSSVLGEKETTRGGLLRRE